MSLFAVIMVTAFIPGVVLSLDEVHKLGNKPVPCDAGIPYANTTFLLEDTVRSDGVLFAFSGYFVHTRPLRLQIWRPSNILKREFRLIHESRFSSSIVNRTTNVYLANLEDTSCIALQTGDRLGVFSETSPSSVCYSFDVSNPVTLSFHRLEPGEAYTVVGQVKAFDFLAFPYAFSIAAFIHADLSPYLGQNPPECPTLQIPETFPDSPSVLQGPRGETGATGEPGVAGATGANGLTGQKGDIGRPGVMGPKGDRGVEGETGPPGPPGEPGAGYVGDVPSSGAQNDCQCSGNTMLNNSGLALGILLWLTAITVIVFGHIVFSCRKSVGLRSNYNDQNSQNKWMENIRETTREYKTEGNERSKSAYDASKF